MVNNVTKKNPSLDKLEHEAQFADDYAEVPPSDIVAYNELRSCADLFRMHEQGILDIQPDFQRDIVWKGADQTRFIDSLIKQLPIPSMCFAYDHKEQKWIVIDGLQRMSSIIRFLRGEDWKLSKLEDIEPNIAGVSVAAIKTSEKKLHSYYTRVENLTIPITVLRCDFRKKSHLEYLFTIFHRLNTGGMKLNNQEIRNCIYGGNLNALLRSLDNDLSWRRINKMKKNQGYRYAKQEIILRFFAFSDRYKTYEGRLAKFLNEYMHEFQDISEAAKIKMTENFEKTVRLIDEAIFLNKAPSKLSVTLLEALLVGVGKNISHLEILPGAKIRSLFEELKSHEEFSDRALSEGLSGKPRVIGRLSTSIKIFASN